MIWDFLDLRDSKEAVAMMGLMVLLASLDVWEPQVKRVRWDFQDYLGLRAYSEILDLRVRRGQLDLRVMRDLRELQDPRRPQVVLDLRAYLGLPVIKGNLGKTVMKVHKVHLVLEGEQVPTVQRVTRVQEDFLVVLEERVFEDPEEQRVLMG